MVVGLFFFALVMRRSREERALEPAEALEAVSVEEAGETTDEAAMPRWRRPSVQAARVTSRYGPPVSRPALKFDAPATSGVERVAVNYRFVRVADAPDDVRSVELGRLDRGDEVDVLDRRSGFALVRAPDGLEGWVPRMTLGSLEGAAS
ncbi:MAG TPA: SH3 domain-containing protein [Candidatus Limnocylindrales bacterium]|nr:SH3 domain-containing protein [Candidatus Limnocylindrales bacterium]